MKEGPTLKNLKTDNNRRYYRRWTVLDVDERVVNTIKALAKVERSSIGQALERLVLNSNVTPRRKP